MNQVKWSNVGYLRWRGLEFGLLQCQYYGCQMGVSSIVGEQSG